MSRSTLIRIAWILGFLVGCVALATLTGLAMEFPQTLLMTKVLAAGVAIFLLLWLLWRGLTLFLWRVGRRLAFSYFLIGVLPIPMVTLLGLLALYLLSGYFLGHLYRDAAREIFHETQQAAYRHLATMESSSRLAPERDGAMVFAYYLDKRKISGADSLPQSWPTWLEGPSVEEGRQETETRPASSVAFVSTDGSSPTIAAIASRGSRGVVAAIDRPLEAELAGRSDVWVQLIAAEDARSDDLIRLHLRDKQFVVLPSFATESTAQRLDFFGTAEGVQGPGWWRQPFIWWGELAGPLHSLEDGSIVSEYLIASLNSNPANIFEHLSSGFGEVDTAVWAGLIAISGILSSIYALAICMAFFMIFSLSRAVNRLSRATVAMRAGDFAARIPVRRRDQIGQLQESFNEMAAGLQRSVAAVAQKEVLEKELEIARQLQQSLLPTDIPSSAAVQFATLFEPSAAIGGDYFDILRLDDDRLVVVIADVSGHGLPTGLRMAMLKAALVILVQEGKPPEEIFKRLNHMVRSEHERHFFVTLTLAVVDTHRGELELTNAGHPPTYLLRDGKVTEIALAGHPLGALGDNYGRRAVPLEDGDVVVWLSDGIIEATDLHGEPFGYERLARALEGPGTDVDLVRDRLLAAEESFTSGRPPQDDKTLVAMRYSVPS